MGEAEIHAAPDPGGWYVIPGHESWHGSDDPRYLRAMILTGTHDQSARARAVLACVERDTPWIVRALRNWRWGAGHG